MCELVSKGVSFRKCGKHSAWQSRLDTLIVKRPEDGDVILEAAVNYYESYDLLNCIKHLEILVQKYDVDIGCLDIVNDIRSDFKLKSGYLIRHGYTGVSSFFEDVGSDTSSSEELAATISAIDRLDKKVETFFERFDWFSPDAKDPDFFSHLFIITAIYNPKVYNYLQIAPFQTSGVNQLSYLRCMFRLGRSEDILMSTNSSSVAGELFFRELAMSDQGLAGISSINEEPLLKDNTEFSRLSLMRNRALYSSRCKNAYRQASSKTTIGLMVSGQLRAYRDCLPLWVENLNSRFDLTVFVATWDSNPSPSFKSTHINRTFSKNVVTALRNSIGSNDDLVLKVFSSLTKSKSVNNADLAEFSNEENTLITSEEIFESEILETFGVLDTKSVNQLKMFLKISECQELANKYQKMYGKFDLCIRMRPDLGFFEISDDDINVALNRRSSVGVLLNQVDGVDDKFALLDSESAEDYTSIWNRMLAAKSLNYLGLDRVKLAESLMLRNIYTSGLNPFLLRNSPNIGLKGGSYTDSEVISCVDEYIANVDCSTDGINEVRMFLAELKGEPV